MAETFDDLVEQYGEASLIPGEDLYRYIVREDVWNTLLNVAKLGADKVPQSEIGKEVRRRAKTDLYWLGKYFLWGTCAEGIGKPIELSKTRDSVHQQIADLFVKKDPDKSIADQDWRKDRLLLYPRGAGKSTWDTYDVVQWVLCFPDIRILYMTAADDLAIGFLDETKSHFVIREDEPSLMNLFFPEYCLPETKLGNAFEFTCPLWAAKQVKRREPTVMAASIISTLSGFHFELAKVDDAVSNRNSENEEQCKKVSKNWHINSKMIMPFGYKDKIGTRYADEDMYGEDLEKNVGDLKKTVGPCWERIDNLTTGHITLIGRAIVIKPEVKEKLEKENRPITYKEAGAEGCDLLFPEHLSYAFLMKEYAKDEISFEGQYNQNPRSTVAAVFPRELLIKHTIPYRDLPISGPVTQTWDLAFSTKKGRDYSTNSTVIWDEQGKFYVIDLVRARMTHSALAKAIVDQAVKWRPISIGIEDAAGSKMIEMAVMMEAKKTGIPEVEAVCAKIDWIPVSNQKDAKRTRMASLHPWLTNDRMWFANYCPFLDIVYSEFERCLESHHHDDIPDVLSQQTRYAPQMQRLIEKKEIQTFSRSDASWNLIFGGGGELYGGPASNDCDPFGRLGYGPPPPISVVEEEEPPVRAEYPEGYGESVLGAGIFG